MARHARVPDALRHGMPRRRAGTYRKMDPGSAAHHAAVATRCAASGERERHGPHSRGANAPESLNKTLRKRRGRRECRVLEPHPQPRVRKQEAHERSHHRSAETNRHSPRDGFTVSFVLAPETGLSCLRHRRDAKHQRLLDISVGISGPHDFAVRYTVTRQLTMSVHRIPRPTFRTMRNAPLGGRGTGGLLKLICPTR